MDMGQRKALTGPGPGPGAEAEAGAGALKPNPKL